MDIEIQAANALNFSKFNKTSSKFFDYGTAGFRDKGRELDFVLYRMGLLAVLKSKAEEGGTVGLMITASHNPEEDNGVKLFGSSGEMLDKKWEEYATELINVNKENFASVLKKIYMTVNYNAPANICLGRDTRDTSCHLLKIAVEAIRTLKADYSDYGLVTTPMLHFLVVTKNDPSYGESSIDGYYTKLSGAFETFKEFLKIHSDSKYDNCLGIDGANGIGALKMKEFVPYLQSFHVRIFNDGSSGKLNYKCGADYVKVEQTFPEGIPLEKGMKYASFDGDADRVVFFYSDENGTFHLLDGDKIASLIAKFLKELVEEMGFNYEIRVIQTAYANGKSTSYIENTLNIPVVCVPTGVKHLHHEAKKYDIGIYFEANGHGTVLFNEKLKKELKAVNEDPNTPKDQLKKIKKLLAFIDIVNETVGDAISDMLLVEAILCDFGWSIQEWDAMYIEYACRQLKVKVPDRKAITTTDANRKCTQPAGLQEAIDFCVSKYSNGRAFVRPSGTEDVVRVYAEAETLESADALAEEVRCEVVKFLADSS